MIVEVCNPAVSSRVKMVCMVGILTWITPRNMHFAGSQIDNQSGDRTFTIHRVNTGNIVIADRVRQIDMVLLDGLQGLDGVGAALAQQTIGPEIPDARGDQFLRVLFDLFHRG